MPIVSCEIKENVTLNEFSQLISGHYYSRGKCVWTNLTCVQVSKG